MVINGNDQLFEKVIRRQLYIRPGQLFSREDLMRSMREIMASGHFNPENMNPDIQPNQNDGTVDIALNLESKANDKVQLSFGWGQTGVTGQVALSFSNFSIKNLFNPGSYRGIIPRATDRLSPYPRRPTPNTIRATAYLSSTPGSEENARTLCRSALTIAAQQV